MTRADFRAFVSLVSDGVMFRALNQGKEIDVDQLARTIYEVSTIVEKEEPCPDSPTASACA